MVITYLFVDKTVEEKLKIAGTTTIDATIFKTRKINVLIEHYGCQRLPPFTAGREKRLSFSLHRCRK